MKIWTSMRIETDALQIINEVGKAEGKSQSDSVKEMKKAYDLMKSGGESIESLVYKLNQLINQK